MDEGKSTRGSFVLNTTITEMILLLFFLLLLLLIQQVIQHQEERVGFQSKVAILITEKSNLQIKLSELEARLNTLTETLPASHKEQVGRILVDISKLDFAMAQKRNSLIELEDKVRAFEKLAHVKRQGIDIEKFKRDELSNIGKLAHCESAVSENATLQRVLETERNDRQRENKDSSRQLREMMDKVKRCGGKGEEYVACWRDEQGHIEYMFDIALVDKGFTVRRAWPEGRNVDMEKFEKAREIVGQTATLDQFLIATQEVFEDSNRRPCRHFVRIYGNRSEMNPTKFSDYRGIQDHFYHWSGIK